MCAMQCTMSEVAGNSPPLVVLVGPTAVGKTELSLRLCEQFDGEVVSADSRQIYQGMDIGTAKATPAEQARVPHHLLDLRRPDQVLTLAEYQQLAFTTIDTVHSRGRVPFLVGGSALYVRSVTAGLRIPEVPPDPVLRAQLEEELAIGGLGPLAARLQQIDPATAAQIDLRNPRRVLRALEIVLITGQPKVALEGAEPPPYHMLQIALTRERGALHRRIDARVEQMVADGLIEETKKLLAAGYAPNLPAMTSLGYREIIAYLQGHMTPAQAVERIQIETNRFVRHQMTWFRKLPDLHWFDMEETDAAVIERLVGGWLRSGELF
jgi:tRNA dimethylallyltransferase